MKQIKAIVGAMRHPLTRRVRRIVRAIVVVIAVVVAVALVTSITVDLGPALRSQAERQGSRLLQRPMHIGSLKVLLWNGHFVLEDFVIEGLTPQSRPFLTAKKLDISMPWSTLFERRVVFDAIEMTDWRMYVELKTDGTHSFPKLPGGGGPRRSAWTTTLQYVRAYRGEFAYEDHGAPWSVVARNLDVRVDKPANDYQGRASFSNGTVKMMNYEPFTVGMSSAFKIDGGRVVLDPIELTTDGTRSRLNGDVNLRYWPEMMFQVRSTIDYPTMRGIFFAHDRFSLFGTGRFDGTFHLFKEPRSDGTSRTSRELKGTFASDAAGINDYRFQDLRGGVRWTPDLLEVTDASAAAYGGDATFAFSMAPLGRRDVRTVDRFETTYRNVDLGTFTNALELPGVRLAGRASGRYLLEWPQGRWSDHRGDGDVHVVPPEGVTLATRRTPGTPPREGRRGPFRRQITLDPIAVGGDLTFAYGPEWIDLAPSRIATRSTYVEIEGRTAYGDRSMLPFHVSSDDWQESDRVFAAVLTAFGSPTGLIDIGGAGTFDGVMLNSFRRPRIEGTFTGEQMRAWNVVWGAARGTAVIENNYADVKSVVIQSGDSTIDADGRFSLGFPRRDGGEELNARVRIIRRPASELRRAFALDDYALDGLVSGEFRVYGRYQAPLGSGTLAVTDGVAYGEPFETAQAGVRLEGENIRLDNIQVVKGGGRATGAAFVGWNGTYSFDIDARGIPIESVAAAKRSPLPLSGYIDFKAGGSGTFDSPRYDVRGAIRDLFAADEGIGQIVGDINISGDLMTLKMEAASPRLAVSGTGRVNLTPDMDAELSFNVSNTSLDPYVRAFQPALSPYTTAVASGVVRVIGKLSDIDQLLVDATVDRLDVRLFDYAILNSAPIKIALDRHSIRLTDMRLIGEGTYLEISGVVGLHDDRVAVRAKGDANLAVLQGLVNNVRASGSAALAATFEGSLRNPALGGTLTIYDGRIRHFALPHALESITGALEFDSRGVTLDGLSARLGGGPVQFSGRVDKEGYLPGRLDVMMSGRNMRVRFPEGMRSLVDANLALQGTVDDATLSGDVTVRDGVYTRDLTGAGGLLDVAGGAAQPTATAAPSAFAPTLPLRYDVRITAPGTLQVRNSILRLYRATADLQLRGTFDRPLVFGRAEVERGEILFEGKRYIVTRGTVDFNNPTRIEPFFDIEAEARVRVPGETYRVTVAVAGTTTRPVMQFSSDPPLPEVEVLALLFSDIAPGRDVELRQYSTVTPQEQLLRERAARALTGTISSEVGRVFEQTFGVDTFQLTPQLIDPNTQSARLDPAARVTIGKRLSERAYLTYSRSLSSSTRDQIILLEYDQTDRLSWVLSRNEDRTYAVEVRVRRSF